MPVRVAIYADGNKCRAYKLQQVPSNTLSPGPKLSNESSNALMGYYASLIRINPAYGNSLNIDA